MTRALLSAKNKIAALVLLTAAASLALAAGDHGTPREDPIWNWSPEEIKAFVGTVRAGRDLSPKSWPNGARVAVSLSFDVDTEPVWIGLQGQSSPSYMSRGEYGARTAQPRVLKLLEKHDIPATFFLPAMSMELHPELVPEILKNKRYEIGFHSYVHENPMRLNEADERRIYKQAMDIFVKHVGRQPAGFRSAAWDLTDATIKIVKEMGFLYESSMMADERPYMLMSNGEETGLIELPVEWILDDWPLFQISWPAKHVAIRNAADVLSIWKGEFDVAYDEGTLYMLTYRPPLPHRTARQERGGLVEAAWGDARTRIPRSPWCHRAIRPRPPGQSGTFDRSPGRARGSSARSPRMP